MELLKSNVLNTENTIMTINATMMHLSSILSKSLGPYGATTIIQDKFTVNHAITKDGYTILNKLKFDNEVADTILDIVKKVSRNLVKEVGDGSTSSIIIAQKLFSELQRVQTEHDVPKKDIVDSLDALSEILVDVIKLNAIPIDDSNFRVVQNIATVSNNNDEEAGRLVHDIYKEIGANGFISLETSPTSLDSYEVTNGIELPRGYISDAFANKPDKVTCELEKPFVLMSLEALVEEDLNDLQEIIGETAKLQRPLIIISKGYDTEVRNFLTINKMQNRDALQIVAVDYALVNKHQNDSFEDLSAYVGATIYNRFEMEEPSINFGMLGICNRVEVNERTTRIIEGFKDEKRVNERIQVIEQQMEHINKKDKYVDTTEEMFQLRKRIADLNCQVATLRVGGNSEIEKETRKFLMEDAIFACQSAIRHGYISGGNLIIPRIIRKGFFGIVKRLTANKSLLRMFDNEAERESFFIEFLNCISQSFEHSYISVLQNRYDNLEHNTQIVTECIEADQILNLKTNKYEEIGETSIINSVETDIQIMKATFSIIGLLATSNQFVSVQYQKN